MHHIFNVADPNSLRINLISQNFGGVGSAEAIARLDLSNSQLSVRLSSELVVSQPYVSFTLGSVDDNTAYRKQFTLSMDLLANHLETKSVDNPSSSVAVSESGRIFDLSSPFKVIAIADPALSDEAADQQQSQQTIATLSAADTNFSHQLFGKDQKSDVFKQQIVELKNSIDNRVAD